MPAADTAQEEQRRVGPAAAEAMLGPEPSPVESGGAGTNGGGVGDVAGSSGGGGGGGGDGDDAATASGTSSFLEDSNEKLRKHARRGEGGEAAALIARMREAGVTPTVRSYTSAINACREGREAQWEQALALLRETATVGGGVTPNTYHYMAAIKTCANANQWEQVGSRGGG